MLASAEKTFTGWSKCTYCNQMIHEMEICSKLKLCPKCNGHFTMTAGERIDLISDEGTFFPLFEEVIAEDLLGFVDTKPYKERLKEQLKKTGRTSAVVTGTCLIKGEKAALGVMDYSFMGGSLGRAEGEKLTCLIEYATSFILPLVIVCASGGARMQESMHSLMQMAKTSAALKRLDEKGIVYLSVLTNPTMGGVSASFAFLGDIIIAEPNALIGFAGPRVIEHTMKEKLKEGDQRSEFHLKNGMIDQIVQRKDLKDRIATFIKIGRKQERIDG